MRIIVLFFMLISFGCSGGGVAVSSPSDVDVERPSQGTPQYQTWYAAGDTDAPQGAWPCGGQDDR